MPPLSPPRVALPGRGRVCRCVGISPGRAARGGIAGLQDIKYCQISLQNDYSKLYALQQIVRVFMSSHPSQRSVFSNLAMFASLIGWKQHIITASKSCVLNHCTFCLRAWKLQLCEMKGIPLPVSWSGNKFSCYNVWMYLVNIKCHFCTLLVVGEGVCIVSIARQFDKDLSKFQMRIYFLLT